MVHVERYDLFSSISIVSKPRGLRFQDDLFADAAALKCQPLLLDYPDYAIGMARGVLTFLYLSWQDVVSLRVVSVASITSNPSDVEVSVDDPLSPIFEEEAAFLDTPTSSIFGCVLASALVFEAVDSVRFSVAKIQSNVQQIPV